MDLSSFPFLNDTSHFLNLYPEVDSCFIMNNNAKQRGIFSSLIPSADEDEKQPEKKKAMDSDQNEAMFERNHNWQAQAMIDYYIQLQDPCSGMNGFDHLLTKRPRRCSTPGLVSDNVGSNVQAPARSGSPSSSGLRHRRLWVKERPKEWWEKCSHPDFPEEEFRRSFRMGKATFSMICDELGPVLIKKNTTLREAIPVKQRVAVCIWSLATGDSLRLVSEQFGLGVSTCHKLVLEVCSAIKTVLMPKVIHWPDESKMKMIKNEYEQISCIPNIGGSIYTTHIPINAPKIINGVEYFNRRHTARNQKTSYSITIQGVVDPKGIFTDVFIGGSGSMNNDQVLEISCLNQRANMGYLEDVWIVGNSGFPLMDWLLVPYTEENRTWSKHVFNEKIGDVQKVAKEAFGRLKGRWGCLGKRREMKLEDLPLILGACCVLHNICEMRNEEMDPEWKFDVFDDEVVPENNIRSANSVLARDYIAYNLLHHGLVRY